jgi:hypothetical protein
MPQIAVVTGMDKTELLQDIDSQKNGCFGSKGTSFESIFLIVMLPYNYVYTVIGVRGIRNGLARFMYISPESANTFRKLNLHSSV